MVTKNIDIIKQHIDQNFDLTTVPHTIACREGIKRIIKFYELGEIESVSLRKAIYVSNFFRKKEMESFLKILEYIFKVDLSCWSDWNRLSSFSRQLRHEEGIEYLTKMTISGSSFNMQEMLIECFDDYDFDPNDDDDYDDDYDDGNNHLDNNDLAQNYFNASLTTMDQARALINDGW